MIQFLKDYFPEITGSVISSIVLTVFWNQIDKAFNCADLESGEVACNTTKAIVILAIFMIPWGILRGIKSQSS